MLDVGRWMLAGAGSRVQSAKCHIRRILTPALSPGERENHRQRMVQSRAALSINRWSLSQLAPTDVGGYQKVMCGRA
jgi:hypothetical protein